MDDLETIRSALSDYECLLIDTLEKERNDCRRRDAKETCDRLRKCRKAGEVLRKIRQKSS